MALTKKQKRMIRTWLKSKYVDEPHPNLKEDGGALSDRRINNDTGDYFNTRLNDLYEKVADVRDSETFHRDFEDEIVAWRDEQFDEIKTKIRSGDKYPIHTTVGQKRVGFKRLM